MFVLALFLYLENEIIGSIGNPKMADNRKMVATCQGSTSRKTLSSDVEKDTYGSWVFRPDRKELTHYRNFTGRTGLPPQAVLRFGQRKPLLRQSSHGNVANLCGRVSVIGQTERNLPVTATLRDGLDFPRKQCFASVKGSPSSGRAATGTSQTFLTG